MGKTIVLANVLNQNGGLTGKASVNCAMQVTKKNACENRSNILMGILTDLAPRLESKATTSFRGTHSHVAKAYASVTTKFTFPDPEDGRAAVNELSKFVQTCIFDSPVVDALGALAAKLQFLIASTKCLHGGSQTEGHHHARLALKAAG